MSVTFPTVQSTPVTESLSFDPLQTLLLPLNNDIPAGVLKHFCSTLNTPEQLFKNTEMVFAYYISEGKISQLIDYLIDREIEECFRTPSSIFRRNSIFTRVIRVFLDNELKGFLKEIVSIVTKHLKQTKFKLVIGNTINADVEKSVVKIAEIINSVLENIVNCQKFPIGFRYFMHKVSVELHKRTPSVETSALKNLIFLRTINSALVHSQSKNQQELDSMKTLSVAFQWFVGDSTEQNIPPAQNWKIQLSEKLGSMRQKVDTWVTTLRDLELDDFFTLSWVDSQRSNDLLPRLKKEWKDVLEYLSTESQGLLSLHFSNEQETMRMYIRLTNELDAFSNGTVKEHSDLLMKMTAMTMQIKDLKAEIKYLKKVLVEKDPTLSYLLDHDH
ncbi:Ras-GAP domain-containing protein [Entamoeba marina]